MAHPRVTDNDRDEITVSLDWRQLRGWSYATDAERRHGMLQAREYVEGWCDAFRETRPQLEDAVQKLNLANSGGLTLLYDIRRALGWNEKTSLSILADGIRRVRRALQTWDTPTEMALEDLALAVKARVIELEKAVGQLNARVTELLEQQDVGTA